MRSKTATLASDQGVQKLVQHLRTASEVAALAGLTPHRVRRIARHRGIGQEFHGMYLFTPDEVDQIVNRKDLRRKDARA